MSTSFNASIHSVKVAADSEATLVLKIPASDLEKVIMLMTMTEKLLSVSIAEDDLGSAV